MILGLEMLIEYVYIYIFESKIGSKSVLPRITEVHKLWYIRKGFGEIVGLREGN
jgi:hypothetical protein